MAKGVRFVLPLTVATLVFGPLCYAFEDADDDGFDQPDDDNLDPDSPSSHSGQLKKLNSIKDFDTFINNDDASIIGAFLAEKIIDPNSKRPVDWDDEEDGEWEPPEIENPAFATFKSIASESDTYRFAFTTASEVLEKLKTKSGGVYLYRSPRYVSKEHGDRSRERFPGETLTGEGILHWLETKAQPLVGEFNDNTMERYKSAVLIIFMNLDFDNNAKSVNYVLRRARKVAVGLKDKLAIAVANIVSRGYELGDYGLTSDKDSDILLAIRTGSDYSSPKYSASRDKPFSEATLSAFAQAYLSGELKPAEKRNDEGKDESVTDKAKDEM